MHQTSLPLPALAAWIPMMVALLWTSCGSSPTTSVPTVFLEQHVEGTVEKTVAQMDVKGMMCEVGCVAKVRKELLEAPGVASAMIDFESGREVNFAHIEYDPALVDAATLVAAVTDIGDGMYPVTRMTVTHHGSANIHP